MRQHKILIKKAQSLGIKTTDATNLLQKPATILEHKGKSELIAEGVPTSWLTVRSQYYCDNKQLTKDAYEKLAIPYPKSVVFDSPEEIDQTKFFQNNQLYVCKPLDGTNGDGVVAGIEDYPGVKQYYEDYKSLNVRFMLEEQVEGDDLRIHILGGKIVAACIRKPAFVVGNGENTLLELIEKRRVIMNTQNPGNKLEVDEATRSLLVQQKITLSDIPEPDRNIQLKFVSNMAQGGIAIDVTEEIHPAYHQWVSGLVNFLGTPYFGLDIMTTDYSLDPFQYAKVLEINARAEWLHHTFSEVRTHDMAGMILAAIYGKI